MTLTLTRMLDHWKAALAVGTLATQAQSVIAYRTLGMLGGSAVSDGESQRMITEKPAAFLKANGAAMHALLSGHGADQVTQAWVAPLSATVQSNRTRLERTGTAFSRSSSTPFK